MKEIRIGPLGQVLAIVSVVSIGLAIVLAQVPEIRRYLKVRSM